MITKSDEFCTDGTVYAYYNAELEFVGKFMIVNDNQIWDLEIFPEFRGNGYATKMLQEFWDLTNPENLVLWVEIENIPAIKSYLKAGFEYVINREFPEFPYLSKMQKRRILS